MDYLELDGVTEYCEGYPVALTTTKEGIPCLRATNEGGYNSVEIDFNQLIAWLIKHKYAAQDYSNNI